VENTFTSIKELKCVVLIPTYNNEKTLKQVIDAVRLYSPNVMVVNDGSTDSTADILSKEEGIHVVSYENNRGKGYALKTGLREAINLGYKYAITIDSDGQHYADDIPVFINEIKENPNSLLVGARNLQAENMPSKNTFANKFSNFWYKVETGITLSDTQSGFRLYPLDFINSTRFITRGYEFEVEVIVRAAWKGLLVKNVPIKVFYPKAEERVSHFKPLRDFTKISILNTYLVLLALLFYYPWRFINSLNKENVKKFISKNITNSGESNFKIALAVALGAGCGVLPAWGYQIWIAIAVAHLTKLNKVIAVVFSNISIPPMIPFILFGSYFLGCKLLGNPVTLLLEQVTMESVMVNLWQYILGACALSVILFLTFFIFAYLILSIFRKNAVR
jgi:glycosyltransferase involved in cell wall biosynthesis